MLPSEAKGPSKQQKCCSNGRVNLLDRFESYQDRPVEIWNLLHLGQHEHFGRLQNELMQMPIIYNDHLSFGRINTNRSDDKFPEKYKIVKINNEIHHLSWDYNAPDTAEGRPRQPLHGQLFTILPLESRERIEAISAENRINVCFIHYSLGYFILARSFYVFVQCVERTSLDG